MPDIAHHAHDLKLFVFRAVILDVLADRIFAGENFLRGGFIDDRDERRALRVVLVEVAAAQKRDAHRLEIIRRGDADVGAVFLGAAGAIESARAVSAGERKPAHGGDPFDTRHPRQALDDLLIELNLAVFFGRGGRANTKYEEAIGTESGIDLRQVREALDHQTRADQQDEGQADFGRDEKGAAPAAAAGAAALALFQ